MMLKILFQFNKKMRARAIFILVLLVSLAAYIIYIYNKPANLEVIFFDVGQGDSALIKTPYGQTILIDGGPDNKVLRRLGEFLPYYERRIDFMLLSHYHDDHAVGLAETARRFNIGQLAYADGSPTSDAIQYLLKYLFFDKGRDRLPAVKPISGQTDIVLGPGCLLRLLNPLALGVKPDANNSLLARLECAEQSFLFSGDNSSAVEKAVLRSGWPVKSLVFKASHHGSNSSNSAEFLNAVNPHLIVISVGADNKFNHPHPKMVDRATSLGIRIKRTDQEGSLLFIGPKNAGN